MGIVFLLVYSGCQAFDLQFIKGFDHLYLRKLRRQAIPDLSVVAFSYWMEFPSFLGADLPRYLITCLLLHGAQQSSKLFI